MMTPDQAQRIMGKNFIGIAELNHISARFGLSIPAKAPAVSFNAVTLKKLAKNYLLILGVPKDVNGRWLTLNELRNKFGVDPVAAEPCFYNQDWYLKESFARTTHLQPKWYLVQKNILAPTRGQDPAILARSLSRREQFPTAILTAYTFFVYYFLTNGKKLWEHDFLWCRDVDHHGDRIYTGRYVDPTGTNKNGFNIHRHLSIRKCYGAITELV